MNHRRLLSVAVFVLLGACADEGASTGGTCPAFANLCTRNNQTAWWHNAVWDPSTLSGGSVYACSLIPIGCHYVFTPQGGRDRPRSSSLI